MNIKTTFLALFLLANSLDAFSGETCADVNQEILKQMSAPFSIDKDGKYKKLAKSNYVEEDGVFRCKENTACVYPKFEVSAPDGKIEFITATQASGKVTTISFDDRGEKSPCVLFQIQSEDGLLFDLDFCRGWKKFKNKNKEAINKCSIEQNKRLCDVLAYDEFKNVSFDSKDEFCGNSDQKEWTFTKRFEHNCNEFMGSSLPRRMVENDKIPTKKEYQEILSDERAKKEEELAEERRNRIKKACDGSEEGQEVTIREGTFIACNEMISDGEISVTRQFCKGMNGIYDRESKSIKCDSYNSVAPPSKQFPALPASPFGGVYGITLGGWL